MVCIVVCSHGCTGSSSPIRRPVNCKGGFNFLPHGSFCFRTGQYPFDATDHCRSDAHPLLIETYGRGIDLYASQVFPSQCGSYVTVKVQNGQQGH